jgi:hypothetical protein
VLQCLPEDHKDGELKGRPIHAATDTPAMSLSKYLAKALQPLLKHVPANLRNTEELIEFISNTDSESVREFCSLDVCNLYRSIPIEIERRYPSSFTVATLFSRSSNLTVNFVTWVTMISNSLLDYPLLATMYWLVVKLINSDRA